MLLSGAEPGRTGAAGWGWVAEALEAASPGLVAEDLLNWHVAAPAVAAAEQVTGFLGY